MKHKILPILLLFSVLICIKAKANETEPNDTKAQANTLALNGNNTGSIGTATDVDWWKVTITGDGKLDVTIAVSNGLYLWCQIYDNDGITLLAQGLYCRYYNRYERWPGNRYILRKAVSVYRRRKA